MPRKATKLPATVLHTNLPTIEVTESWLLDTLLADPNAAASILVRLDERVAVVAPERFDTLLTRLRKLGHTPKVLAE